MTNVSGTTFSVMTSENGLSGGGVWAGNKSAGLFFGGGAEQGKSRFVLDAAGTSIYGQKVTLSSASDVNVSNSKITSLAAGVADDDAVTVHQLNDSIARIPIRSNSIYEDLNFPPEAINRQDVAVGWASHAEGGGITRKEDEWQVASATALGARAQAKGVGAVALGANSWAKGDSTSAIGSYSYAGGYNSVALGTDSKANRDNSVSIGSKNIQRQITNMAAGTADTDATNVAQLKGIATALGGGAGIGADGSVTAPAYTLDSGKTIVQNVGDALSNLDGRVTTNASDIESLKGELSDSDKYMKARGTTAAQATGARSIAIGDNAVAKYSYGPGEGGDTNISIGANSFTSTEWHQVALGDGAYVWAAKSAAIGFNASATSIDSVALGSGSVADRRNTVSIGSEKNQRQIVNVAAGTQGTDAVNVTQLSGVTTALGGGAGIGADGSVTAPQYHVGDKTYGNVGDAITAAAETGGGTDPNAVAYDDAAKSTVTLAGEQGTTLKNVAAGAVNATSMEAVNGSQLYGASQSVASALGGGSTVDAAGKLTAPAYTLDGGKTTAHNVGDALSNLDGRVTTNATNVEKLQGNFADTGLLDAKTGKVTAAVTSDQMNAAIAKASSDRLDAGRVTIGKDAYATGNNVAVGEGAKADTGGAGAGVIAIGANAAAGRPGYSGAIAIGDGARAVDGSQGGWMRAVAVGAGAQAQGVSVAIGPDAQSSPGNGVALGDHASVGANATWAVALGTGSVADRADTVSVGNAKSQRQIVNVAAGTQDTDVVNVTQLKGVATALGGGAGIGADGSVTAPKYHVGDKTYGNVGDAITAAAETGGGGGADPNAVAYDDAAKSTVTLAGEQGTTLKNVAAGAVNATSLEAMNGSQLYGTSQSVASALGGGSTADAAGKLTAPAYTLDGGKTTAQNVGDAVSNLDGRVTTNATNVEELQDNLAESGLWDKDKNHVIAAVTYGLKADGTADRGSVTLGGAGAAAPVALKNVAVGTADTDAANVSQLKGVATALGGGAGIGANGSVTAPKYHVGDKTYGNVGDAITAAAETGGGGGTDPNAVAYDDAAKSMVTLAGEQGTTLKNVGAGAVNATSMEAMNGSQLYGTSQSVASALGGGSTVDAAGKLTAPAYTLDGGKATAQNVGDAVSNLDGRVTTNATNVEKLQGDIAESGLVDKDTGKAIAALTYDRKEDGTADRGSVTLGGAGAAAPVALKNVAVGTTDTDAVNVSQLKGVTTVLGGGAGIGADGSVTAPKYHVGDKTYGNVGDAITAAAETGGGGGTNPNAVSYDDKTKGAITLAGEKGTTLKNVAAGVAETDAVNVGQLSDATKSIRDSLSDGSLSMRYIKVKATGQAANAMGTNTVAIGAGANATGNGSLALGTGSRANGLNSVAIGLNSVATEANQISVGDVGRERRISNVADGTEDTDAVNVNQLTEAIEKMSDRTDKLSSELRSRHGSLTANVLAAKTDLASADPSKFLQVAGAGADGSQENTANIVGGDPASDTAAAIGVGSIASGANAVALGVRSYAYSDGAVAIGNMAQTGAGQANSVAIGSNVTTNGESALAVGSQARANGDNAIALGNNGVAAIGANSIALGNKASSAAGATNGIALGASASVARNVADSMALGANASVEKGANSAVALGTGSKATRANTVSVGNAGSERQIVNVAAGTQGTDAVNVTQLSGVTTALGGGAGIGADGSVTAPKYHVGDKTYGNVGDAITAAAETGGGGGTDPNAVSYDDKTKGAITLAGEQGTTLKNVAAGAVNATSMEAMNGAQLYGTSQSVASVLGGGSTVDAAGKLTAPAYTLDGGKTTTHNVGDAFSNLDGRVTTNATNVEKLQGDIAESGLIDKDTGKAIAALTYDRKADGTTDRGSLTLGGAGVVAPVALKNVAGGISDTDAVNVGQMKGITTALGGDAGIGADGSVKAPTYHIGDKTYANVGDALAAAAASGGGGTDSNAVLYDDAAKSAVTLSGEKGTTLKKVAAGAVNADSTEAVNGSQLYGAAQSVASALGGESKVDETGKLTAPTYTLEDGKTTAKNVGEAVSNLDGRVTTNTTNLEKLQGDFAESGLVDKNTRKVLAAVTYDRNDGTAHGNSVTLGGADAAAPVALKNVADGAVAKTSTDALNGSQLYGASQSVASALGGDSIVDAGGTVRAPTYTLDGGKTTAKNVGEAVSNLDGRVTTNATNVGKLQDNLAESGLFDKDKNQAIAALTYDRKEDGTVDRGSVTLGGAGAAAPVALKNVAMGIGDTDAANVRQVKGITTALGGDAGIGADGSVTAPKYRIGDKTYGNVGDALAAAAASGGGGTDSNAVLYDDAAKTAVTLSGEKGTTLKNVAAGAVNATSMEAMNGSQLYGTSQSVASALGGGSTVDAAGKVTAPTIRVGNKTYGNVSDAIAAAAASGGGGGKGSSFVTIDGMGSDGSRFNTASIATGDPESTTAAAIGVDAHAAGANAIALGLNTGALSNESVAIGNMAQTGSDQSYSVAIGSWVTTNGAGALAIGSNAKANGENAVALGSNGIKAIGASSIAIGNAAEAAVGATNGIAMGASASVAPNVTNAMALGANTSVEGAANGAVALGAGAKATRANTVSVGDTGSERQIVNVAAGTQGTDAVNVAQLSGVTTALGGGAGIGADGSVTAPKYHVGNKTYGNVGDAITAAAEIGSSKDPNAVAYDDETKSTVTLAGEKGTALKNVAAGAVNATSMEAVNGSQLYGTSQSVASALGGGATVDAAGKLTAPAYTLDGGKTTAHNVGDAVSNLDGRVTTTATNVEKLQDDIAESGLVDKDTGKVIAAVTYDRKEDGTADHGSVTLGGAGAKDPVALKNVAAGAVNATSTEAVNGSQLYGTSQSVASALGGGSTVDAAGKLTAPAYTLDGGKTTAHNVGDAVSNLDGRVTTNATNVEKLQDDVAESGLVDKETGKVIAAVTYDRKEDGTADRGSVTLGGAGAAAPVALKNVAAGAVNATSTEAVNGSQLYGTSQSVASALGGGSTVDAAGKVTAPNYHVGDKTYGNVGDAIVAAAEMGSGTDPNAVAYDDEAKSAVTLAGEQGTALKNVAAGAVNATSMEAVNGSQLYGASQSVASALGGGSTVDAAGKLTAPAYTLDGGKTTAHNVGNAVSNLDGRVTTNATNVETLQDDIAESGLVDKDTGKVIAAVTYDRKEDGTADRGSVTLGGAGAAAPVALKNVAAGVDDSDAVNVGQLNTGLSDMKRELAEGNIDLKYIKVRASDAPATATGAQSVAIGSKALAGGSNTLALGAGARALASGSVALGSNSVANEAMTVSVGDDGTERKIVHVRAGDVTARSTDAINGSQLFEALGKLKSRVAAEQSHLLSRVNALADSDESNSLVAVDGMGGTNSASISGGDPESTTAAAIGVEAHAAGANAIALGLNTGALSDESVAIGNMAQTGADQSYSVAIGSKVTTNGAGALAIGSNAKANGENAVAVGNNGIKAIGESSIAIGNAAEAAVGATNGIALGTSASVAPNVANAMALGANTSVDDKANGAVALGAGAKATRANTVSVGNAGSERQIVNVAAGTQGTDAVNVTQLSGVTTALGGGAGIGADGSVTAPKYHVGDKTYGNVGDAITAAAASGGGGGTDPNAVAYDDAAKSTVTLAGEQGTTLKNVAAGAVNATSTEAVNGAQLYGASQSMANALGGGSQAGADGTISAPSYSLAGGTTTVNSVGAAIGNLDGRVTANTGDISTLKDTIANSGLIDPETGQAVAAVRYDRNEDGSANRASVTLGDAGTAVGLHNVAAGAVSATSTDAVNGSQLHGMATSVANAIGGDTTVDENGQVAVNSIEVGGHKYATVSQAVQAAAAYGATDSLAVRYDVDSHGNPNYGSVTLGGPAAAPVMLTNVADGKSQYDAVNYGQLSSLKTNFENRLDTMDDRVSKIETTGGSGGDSRRTVGNDLISGSGEAGQAVTAAQSGNGSNNVAMGSGSTINDDAGNATAVGANATVRAAGGTAIGAGADAHAANSTAIGQDSSAHGENSAAIGQGAKARGDNSVAIGAGSVANEDNTVSFGDGSDQGKRRIVNIADGVNASDAATKGQLDRAVGGLQGQINGVSRNAYSGIAAATALTMIPGVDPGKTLSFGIGSASYKGYQAVAFGGEARINKNLKMKAGVGLSSGGNTVGLGASYQW
ncbi:YadA-like family protein [Burkholderia orbicola]|uniref:YadA-like family protein n=2 Tax=Burkholderia TaxID=32008 RepID=A0ABT8P3E9_9BURK|nr:MULTISPECIES: YadA-like family protein [Burkholderia cepacia complex]MDN7528139.1 YadA-like family protein [Burkholderia orbicola]MDN7991043.1 YadA-like family protein [Burkholderia orbicola]